MKAIRLRTEYLVTPLGIDVLIPRFFWNCEDGKKQTAYQICCTCEGETIWDSGKVYSDKMTGVFYEGRELISRAKVIWSVRLWDEQDNPGEAVYSHFEM